MARSTTIGVSSSDAITAPQADGHTGAPLTVS
jgi:hypothetical protein